VWKISPQLAFDPQTIQPVVCCHINYAILTHASITQQLTVDIKCLRIYYEKTDYPKEVVLGPTKTKENIFYLVMFLLEKKSSKMFLKSKYSGHLR
jgi:hypothetical protein